MYSLVTGMYQAYLAPTQLNILVVGGSGVGKTTMLERIKVTKFATKISNQPRHKPAGSIKDRASNAPTHWLKDARMTMTTATTTTTDNDKNNDCDSNNNNNNGGEKPRSVENGDTTTTTTTITSKDGVVTTATASKKKGRSSWLCPAPARYAESGKEEEEEDGEEDSVVPLSPADLMGGIPSPNPQRNLRKTTTSSSMESVDLVVENAARAACKVATCCVVDSTARDDFDQQNTNNDNNNKDWGGDTTVATTVSMSVATTASSAVMPSSSSAAKTVENNHEAEFDDHEDQVERMKECDLKPNAKMLPLSKIRRTIGMNLGKVNIQGVACHFWDLGGRMHELWERYYADSDAVIFVWKTPSHDDDDYDDHHAGNGGHNEDDDDWSKPKPIDSDLQQSLLEEVRNSIPDDVPFLVLGHLFLEPQHQQQKKKKKRRLGQQQQQHQQQQQQHQQQQQQQPSKHSSSTPMTDVLYSTDRLLPHYHNPYQALFFANAANGQGVKSAMEWLIPIAKRQLKVRETRPMETDH